MIFCVYLTIYRGNKLPPFYIGSTSVDKINNGYRGSVLSKNYKRIWKDEIKTNPDLFKTVIISLHDTRKEASDKEAKLQQLLNVISNPLYTNQNIIVNGHVCYTSRKGVKFSEDHRSKISNALSGIKRDPSTIAKIRTNLSKRGPVSESTKSKMSRSRMGFVPSDETRRKISESQKGRVLDNNQRDNLALLRSNGMCWIVIDPNGSKHTTINLRNWCRDVFGDKFDSASSSMNRTGKYKGYIAYKETINV